MKFIILTQGYRAIVDDEDYDRLSLYRWQYSQGRAKRGIKKDGRTITILMHREIMSPLEGTEVDHIDRDPLNNQKSNLRLATHKQNMGNQRLRKTNRSGYHGVFFDKSRSKWCAQVKVDGRSTFLGRFMSEIDAAKAYNEGALKHFKSFASLNYL